jgi:hypothetical protein
MSQVRQPAGTEVASVSYVESVAGSIREEYLSVYDTLASRP